MEELPQIYGLEFQARALASQSAEAELNRFLVGTLTTRSENQVHLIEFCEDDNVLHSAVYRHSRGEVWYISSNPSNVEHIATCYSEPGKPQVKASIWKLPEPEVDEVTGSLMQPQGEEASPILEELLFLDGHDSDVRCVAWSPNGEGNRMLTLCDTSVHVWDTTAGSASAKIAASASQDAKKKFTTAKWNPHHKCNQLATAQDFTIHGWDVRSMKPSFSIEAAHEGYVRDLDFNPNRQYYMATGGEDCCVRFWDIRKSTEPLHELKEHSHWVWAVRFNHFHDQLLLTSGSDNRVVLSNVSSLSSDPYGSSFSDGDIYDDDDGGRLQKSTGNDDNNDANVDRIICSFEEHEDSVYGVEWSAADPWIFASLSYDGRLVVNHVPREEKYKILL